MKQLYAILFSLCIIPALAQVAGDRNASLPYPENDSRAPRAGQELVKKTSQQDEKQQRFSVNFNEGILKFENPHQDVLQVQVVNITGKVVRQTVISDKTADLYVNDLPPGLYLIRVEDQAGRRSVRKVYFR